MNQLELIFKYIEQVFNYELNLLFLPLGRNEDILPEFATRGLRPAAWISNAGIVIDELAAAGRRLMRPDSTWPHEFHYPVPARGG